MPSFSNRVYRQFHKLHSEPLLDGALLLTLTSFMPNLLSALMKVSFRKRLIKPPTTGFYKHFTRAKPIFGFTTSSQNLIIVSVEETSNP